MEYELWDLYDKDRNPTDEVVLRGTRIPRGKYHIVVECMILDRENRILITKRSPGKHHAFSWECTTGSIMSGEDSLTGVIREIKEETGLDVPRENIDLIRSEVTDRTIRDTYLACVDHIDLSKVVLQPGETIDAKTCTLDQFQNEEFDEADSNAAFLVAQYSRLRSVLGKIMTVRDKRFGIQEEQQETIPVHTKKTGLARQPSERKLSATIPSDCHIVQSDGPLRKAVPDADV
ncbi:MAG: NUDIX domain-containing protein [Lachnospiraceae bacterium]|nr:NUDIX domain-containing protein [Lachnospiraceae bacterium]